MAHCDGLSAVAVSLTIQLQIDQGKAALERLCATRSSHQSIDDVGSTFIAIAIIAMQSLHPIVSLP